MLVNLIQALVLASLLFSLQEKIGFEASNLILSMFDKLEKSQYLKLDF